MRFPAPGYSINPVYSATKLFFFPPQNRKKTNYLTIQSPRKKKRRQKKIKIKIFAVLIFLLFPNKRFIPDMLPCPVWIVFIRFSRDRQELMLHPHAIRSTTNRMKINFVPSSSQDIGRQPAEFNRRPFGTNFRRRRECRNSVFLRAPDSRGRSSS